MSTPSAAPRHSRPSLLIFIAVAATCALALHGPIVQWASYHHFADTRSWGALPNALNVLSNLPFAAIGLWGWWRLRGAAPAWRAFSAAIAATAIGSSVYHWRPGDVGLLVDRLPIAWACASLLCAFLAERIDTRWERGSTLASAWIIATAAVAWWGFGQAHGAGDLRPYVLVQFMPMLLIPAALLLKPGIQSGAAVRDRAWWAALALYACAKGTESADASIMAALHFVSGHSLKHLLAATAAAVLLQARVSSGSRR